MQIKGSTFLIAGGSSGLGAACARRFTDSGARVVVADVNEQQGASLCKSLGDSACFVRTDVTSADDVEAALAEAAGRYGRLHGAVNCAGILGAARVVGRNGSHDLSLFARVVEVNLVGTFNVTRLVAAVLSAAEPDSGGERGVIVNTASVAATEGQIGQAAYSASKGGVAAMTLPIARELAPLGIRVVAIAPGVFSTPMVDALPEKARASLEAQTVFPPRLGQPEEFAALAAHVVENQMLNGTVVRLDGAVRMGAK